MDKYNIPERCKNLTMRPLYKNKDEIYIVGDSERDSFVVLSKADAIKIYEYLNDLNGKNTYEELSLKWGVSTSKVHEIVSEFRDKNLLDSEKFREKYTEVNRFSVKVFNISVERFFDKISIKSANVISKIINIIFLLIILALLCNFEESLHIADTIFKLSGELHVNNLALSFVIMIPSFFIHELSHSLVARKFGLPVCEIRGVLYLAIFPMVYVRIKNIYMATPHFRIRVLIAGVIANFYIIIFCFAVYKFFPLKILIICIISQINIIIVNLNPLVLSDGYFILITLLKTVNIRLRSFKFIAKNKKYKAKGNMDIIIYILLSVVAIYVNISYFNKLIRFINYTRFFPIDKIFFDILLTMFVIMIYYIIIRVRYRKL